MLTSNNRTITHLKTQVWGLNGWKDSKGRGCIHIADSLLYSRNTILQSNYTQFKKIKFSTTSEQAKRLFLFHF